MNAMISLTAEQLRKAADLKEQIEGLQQELNQVLGGSSLPAKPVTSKKRKLSAAGLANIRAAQKARWAAMEGLGVTAAKAESKPAKEPKKKSQASEAKLAALARAREARWAKVRAAKKAQPGTASKEAPKKKKPSEALLKALAKARAARSAKAKAAKDDVPF